MKTDWLEKRMMDGHGRLWGTSPPAPLRFIAGGQSRNRKGTEISAPSSGLGPWDGARVAPQRCPVFRPGGSKLA